MACPSTLLPQVQQHLPLPLQPSEHGTDISASVARPSAASVGPGFGEGRVHSNADCGANAELVDAKAVEPGIAPSDSGDVLAISGSIQRREVWSG
jgi:hypothetical protein